MSPAHNAIPHMKTGEGEIPDDFNEGVIKTINRILVDPAVLGIVYFRDHFVHMCTAPTNMRRALTTMLPTLNDVIYRSVKDIHVLDDLIAYRIATKSVEILVAGGKDMGAVVVQHRDMGKKKRKKIF